MKFDEMVQLLRKIRETYGDDIRRSANLFSDALAGNKLKECIDGLLSRYEKENENDE